MSNTGHKHVYKLSVDYGKPYAVYIRVRRRAHFIGCFVSIPEAVAAARGFNKGVKVLGLPWRFTRQSPKPRKE